MTEKIRRVSNCICFALLAAFFLNAHYAFAHDGVDHGSTPFGDSTQTESDPLSDSDIPHQEADVIPTLDEEADLLDQAEAEQIGHNADADVSRAPTGNEHIEGKWGPVENWPVIGVFVSLLGDGRVLAYDSVGDNPTESYPNHTFTRATVWDPVTNTHSDVEVDTGRNIFCSGFASLPNGELYIAGGNADSALNGIDDTHTFNPLTDSWALGPDMSVVRWYPSVTPLPNGEMLVTGGGPALSEVRRTNGTLRPLTNAQENVWANRNYPWLQTAPDGRVAFLGPANQLGYVTTSGSGAWQATTTRDSFFRSYGSYVMYQPDKVLVAGGGNGSTNQRSALIIDLNDDSITSANSMANRRRQHNLTVLADGTVLATGGFASNAGLVDLNTSVFEPELWNPATGQWTAMAAEARARQYHSTALLLPDGRVLSAGGGICGACQAQGYIQKNAQIFSPPYLFVDDGSGDLSPRPVIGAAPDAIGYGSPFTVASAQANAIQKVGFVRVGSVTHAQNMEQRYVPTGFSVQNGNLQIDAPTNANVAPPGSYMLFIVDGNGTPSVAKIINIQATNNEAPYANFSATPTSGNAPLTVSFNASASYDNDGSISSRSWNFGDGATGSGNAPSHTYTAVGSYTARLTITDNDGATNTTTMTINVGSGASCAQRGLFMESWDGVVGTAISDLTGLSSYPQSPSSSLFVSNFEIPVDVKDTYGVRLRGYIEPGVSGDYTFWIASDDNGELWLSSDENPANITQIANVPSWTNSREWNKFVEQQSGAISLQAGQRYYVEALMKEWGGGDNLAVAWQRAGSSRAVIGNGNLCAYQPVGNPPVARITSDVTSGDAPLTVNFSGATSSDSDGTIVSYEWVFGDGSTASGVTAATTYALAGMYSAELTTTDNDGRVDSTTRTITVNSTTSSCTTSGLTYERWTGIPGVAISDLTSIAAYPDSPNFTDVLTNFEAGTNILDSYGARVRGYIDAPITGSYIFWIASDDNGELWLSSNDDPANASRIASVPSWTPSRQWDWHPEQQSASINLVAGQRYYVEALMKEFGGGDNLAVAWQIPGGSRQVIPNAVLCQLIADSNARPNAVLSATPTSGDAPLAVSFSGNGSTDDGTIVSYQWDFGDGGSASGLNRSHTYTSPGVYLATLTVTDDGGKTDTATTTIAVTQPGGNPSCNTNGVLREVWNNVWNGDVALLVNDPRYPDNPTSSGNLSDFVAPSNVGDGYGARMQAYLVAPETGSYTFWVASDNEGQLWLSSDNNPSNATQIAQTFWSPEQGWDSSSSQQSATINLIAGEYYYIEGLHYASWGSDYFAVAWDTPSGAREVIPQSALCVLESGGRIAGSGAGGGSLLMQSSVAQSFPLALYDDLLVLLMADQPLREELLALGEQTALMLQSDVVVSADYLQTVTTLYNAVYASASPDLQAWFDTVWSQADIAQYQDDGAVTAWIGVNQTAVPTAVALGHAPVQPALSGSVLVAIGAMLAVTVGAVWLRRRSA